MRLYSIIYNYGSTFHNNTALSGVGIAIHQGSVSVVGSNFINSYIMANQHRAALIYNFNMDSYVFLSVAKFEGNVTHSFAGAVATH